MINKKKSMLVLFMLFSPVILGGCTVGRYVTNISAGGPDSLIVEKCVVKEFSRLIYWVDECSSSPITVTYNSMQVR